MTQWICRSGTHTIFHGTDSTRVWKPQKKDFGHIFLICDYSVPPHLKMTLFDWDLVILQAIWVQAIHWGPIMCQDSVVLLIWGNTRPRIWRNLCRITPNSDCTFQMSQKWRFIRPGYAFPIFYSYSFWEPILIVRSVDLCQVTGVHWTLLILCLPWRWFIVKISALTEILKNLLNQPSLTAFRVISHEINLIYWFVFFVSHRTILNAMYFYW